MNYIFTVTQHLPRKLLKLTLNQYAVLDAVYKHQTHPIEGKNGYTEVGCHAIGDFLDLSPATVKSAFKYGESMGYLEFLDKKKRLKKVTEAFFRIAYETDVQKLNVQKMNGNRSETERPNVQKMNGNRSENERHINKKEEFNKKELFIAPDFDTVAELMKASLLLHVQDERKVEAAYLKVARKYFNHNTVNNWINAKGNRIKSLAGSVNTWAANAADGEVERIWKELKRADVQTILFAEGDNELRYDKAADESAGTPLRIPKLKTV